VAWRAVFGARRIRSARNVPDPDGSVGGAWGLLFAWVPFVGDVFVLGAGLAGTRFAVFVVLVTAGKAGRYWLVAQAVAKVS